MATRNPLVQVSGEVQQLQSGDPLSPVAVAVLRVLADNYTMPANSSLTFINSLTLSNNVSFTIPSTSTVLITTGDNMYWDALRIVTGLDFTTGSLALVDITGLSCALLANTKYEIEGLLLGQGSDSSGVQFAVAYSVAGATGSYMAFSPSSSGTSSGGVGQLGNATGVSVWTSGTIDCHTFIKAIVSIGANAGNITFQVKKITAGTLTIRTGGIMKVRKLI